MARLHKNLQPWQSSVLYRYSKRLAWSVPQNAFTRVIEEKRGRGEALLDLTVSNPTLALPDYPGGLISAAFARAADLTYHPNPFGTERARIAVSRFYAERGFEVSPGRIALTASTSEAYSLLFKLLCDPGDEILIPIPSYPLFEFLAKLDNVQTVPYRLLYDGSWFIDFDHLRASMSASTRAIVIVNPNNPTGSFLKRSETEALLQLAHKSAVPVISDEVFMDYGFAAERERVRTLVGQDAAVSFSLNGLSKSAGMPQVKLAWIVINGAGVEIEPVRKRLELLLDTYLSVSTPVQLALPDLLQTGNEIAHKLQARTKHNLQVVKTLLAESPIHVLLTEGGWSVTLQLPRIMSEEEWIIRMLRDHSVMLQPGYFFDMPSEAYCVASLITEPVDFFEGISRLRSLARTAA